ncbi:hypothetical protein DCMF_14675 [Candidatus Formimonas warabiya]|uniref:Uncharacterized protein n=1 Tax=Formimonas warabiya TaxID=1761012 RepID=A0A3G1KTV9_FORW1|nr:hypothetical protein DCMF_14675 [Candidatus Formimonas warabiya]
MIASMQVNQKQLAESCCPCNHSQLKNLTPEYMSKDLVYPLHPGAEKAYQEKERGQSALSSSL